MSTESRALGRPTIHSTWRLRALAAAVTVGLLLGILYIQHRRQAWPFSLHHGLTAAASVAAASSRSAQNHAGGAHPRGAVALDPQRAAFLGIRTEPVRRELITPAVRAVAVVMPDESRVSHMHTRVSGWIEKLYVTTTGQSVRAGQPLAEIFSQELLASQSEYLAARVESEPGSAALAEAGRSRLAVLGMTPDQIADLDRRGTPSRTVTVMAPRAGIVLRRGIALGTTVDPSTEILTIADLSRVWAIAEIPEGDIPDVRVGTPARLSFPASGLGPIEARVTFLAPTLSEQTRSLRARFELDNRGARLRPGLFGTAELSAEGREVLTVPRDAIVDTGTEQLVFVASDPGHFQPRAVEVGVRVGERTEVRAGLVPGQLVVSAGVFLIDSESRLRASGGDGRHSHGQAAPSSPAAAPAAAPAREGHEGH